VFHIRGPILGFSEIFQINIVVTHGDILRSMALVLGVNKLLKMERDVRGLYLIAINKLFFQLISHSIVL